MKIFRRIQKLLFISAITLVFVLNNIAPVYAATKAEYFLTFLYSMETKTFGSAVIANTSRESLESSYSKLDSTKSIFLLESRIKGLWTPSDRNMLLMGSYLKYHPFTFPEFNDVEGTQSDYAMAMEVGNALTKSLNNAMAYIIKPVSTAGRKELQLDQNTTV